MRPDKLAAYLDVGTVSVFARQIVDAIDGVSSVALHDPDGRLLWAGPDEDAAEAWPSAEFLYTEIPPGGHKVRSGSDAVHVFPLVPDDDGGYVATLSLRFTSVAPANHRMLAKEVQSFIRCVERQMTINCELSSLRRLSREDQRGIRLLMNMDRLGGCASPKEILRSILDMAFEHYGVAMAAVVLPKLGIQETVPASLLETPKTERAVMATLGALVSGATLHRQVLKSETNLRLGPIPGLTDSKPQLLCAPIINARDEVIGILVLLGSARFSKAEVRLARAICAKINSLVYAADRLSAQHQSRRSLVAHAENFVHRHRNTSHAMLYVDVDKLHVVNDSLGHVAGDSVIRAVSRIVADLCGKDDAFCHLGSDLFAVFLSNADESRATEWAQSLVDAIAGKSIRHEELSLNVTASIGVALVPQSAEDAASALSTAEVATRSAKGRGGNQAVLFRDIDASVVQRRSDLDQVGELQSALLDNRFELFAQPIRPLNEEENSYRFEILLRMRGANGALIPPDRFLSAADRYQLMNAIDRWVIRHTLDMLSSADNLLEVCLGSFSINLCAQSLVDEDFLDFLVSRIHESGVSPDALVFEITETAVVRHMEKAQRCIKRLRRLGCRVALDDFGTGYCSFAYLKDLPVQYLKVDGVFIRDILDNPLSEAILVSMTRIAKVMNAMTVAEHVESELVMQRLRQYGIDFAQGFAIGKPRPLATVLSEMGPALAIPDERRQAQ